MKLTAASFSEQETAKFWAQVDMRGQNECWPWLGSKLSKTPGRDYGIFSINGKSYRAHRVAIEVTTKSPLGDLFSCHSCDNPPCVNPYHLWAGTHLDNVRDMNEKGRHRVGGAKNHCPSGHEFTPENLTIDGKGSRRCKTCWRVRANAKRKRRQSCQQPTP